MDGKAILLAQVHTAEADLDAVEGMLRAPVFDGFPERDEILARLLPPIEDLRSRLADARRATRTVEGWPHLNSARLSAVTPLQEALALLGGMLLRQARLDDDVVLMSDMLQTELGQRLRKVAWPKASVPDVDERYHRVSELIRVRFPTTSIWSLPVVAHEVGHAVVARFAEVVPGTSNNRLAFQVEYGSAEERELVCDVIATLALGPAYVSSCLLLRFFPSSADQAFDGHPPERERAEVMLQVLRDMSYEDTAQWLRTAWVSAMGSAGINEPAVAQKGDLGDLARRLRLFTVTRLPDLVYSGMDRVDELAAYLDEVAQKPPDPPNMIDALNAAWLVRRRNWGSEGALDGATAAACHELCRSAARRRGGTR